MVQNRIGWLSLKKTDVPANGLVSFRRAQKNGGRKMIPCRRQFFSRACLLVARVRRVAGLQSSC
jgi:uncharacterized membrane protein